MLQTVISLLTLCIVLSTLTPLSSARQIRISRYNVQVTEDGEAQEINATVREVTPYPAAGYRPGRAFKLPIETTTALPEVPMTTELALDDAETTVTTETEEEVTTTESYSIETTTPTTTDVDIDYYENAKTFRGYPARGYEPRVPFNLPTQNKNVRKNIVCNNTLEKIDATAEENVTPYPAAGYRPCQPFILPTENQQQQQHQQEQVEQTEENILLNTNKNPACGVSLNPLAPKPPAGSVDEPDAERVPVTTNTGNGKSNVPIVASVANPAFVSSATLKGPQPIIWQQPLTVLPQQPFVYTTHLQTW